MLDILALDLSLAGTGVCYNGSASTIKNKLKDEARLNHIIQRIDETGLPGLVIVEGLAYGTQTGKAMERAGLWWLVKLNFYNRGIPVAVCPPTVLKKFATGKGNAAKDEVMIAAVKQLPFDVANNNEADAGIMYLIAKERTGTPIFPVPKDIRTMIDTKIIWPEGF